ncbi:hypothetical protein Vau01_123620 [Virgisporangium aurantiacum]|uniref:Hsp70 protein n=1 Tax=Virgisporangium aurantiacum TaxID=175570 RepID=A0A8J3ZJC6_9ACTN|nr:hypothetical protein Vau01_123620 [Virgisporangium aurantiacum]
MDASNGVGWARVCIDLGSARTVAVVFRSDGSWQPLRFDGEPYLPSGVFRSDTGRVLTGAQAIAAAMTEPDHYLADPAGQIRAQAVGLGGDPVAGVVLVGAVFRRVLDQTEYVCGGPVPEVVVVVPPGWGPPRRQLLEEAAQYAGVRRPIMVPAAVAVAAHTDGLDLPVARWVAVCDLGARAVVTVVRRNVSGFDVIAELDADAGGDRIDDALATYLAVHHPPAHPTASHPLVAHSAAAGPGPATARQDADPASAPVTEPGTRPAGPAGPVRRPMVERLMLRTAKEAATSAPGVVVPGVNGGPAAMLTAAHVHAAAAPVIDTAVKAVRQAVEAAEVTAETGCGLLLVGGTARIPGLAEDFAAGTGLPTRVLPQPELATALAALRAASNPDTPITPLRRDRPALGSVTFGPGRAQPGLARPGLPPWSQLLAPLVPAVASVLLAVYATLAGEGGDRYPGHTYLAMNTGQVAMAAVLAVVAGAAAGAHFGPALQPVRLPARRPPAGLPVTAGILAATGLGLATGAFYAVAIAAYYQWPYHAQLLRWTLIPAIPLAAIIAVAAWLVYRGVPEPGIGWGPAMTIPHPPIILATVGMCTMTWAYHHVHPGDIHWRYLLIARCGALLIGLATAYVLADRHLTQTIAAVPLGIITAALADYRTTGILAGIWITAVACCWIRRTWQIGTYGIPTDNNHARPGR